MLIYVDTRKQVETQNPPGARRRGRRGDLVRGEPCGSCCASCAGNRRAAFEYEVPE